MSDSQLFCDVPLAFGCWLEMLMQVGTIETMPVVQSATTDGCQRPLIWFETTDVDDRERTLDPKPIYIPTYVGIDLEVISDDGDQVELIAGNIRAACNDPSLYRNMRWGPLFDKSGNEIFQGCLINRISATGHNADYSYKAPGTSNADLVIGTFIEIHTKH